MFSSKGVREQKHSALENGKEDRRRIRSTLHRGGLRARSAAISLPQGSHQVGWEWWKKGEGDGQTRAGHSKTEIQI